MAVAPAPALPLAAILRAVAGEPRTAAELARTLGSTEGALSGMLGTLLSGGYVQEASQGQGACACGPCALKSLCRNADSAEPSLGLLRLTPRGEGYLARQQGAKG